MRLNVASVAIRALAGLLALSSPAFAGGPEVHDISFSNDLGTVQYNKNGENVTYKVVPVTWVGDIGNGRVVNITANSAESLFKYVMKLNPDYLFANGQKSNVWNHTHSGSQNKSSSVHAAAAAAEPPVSVLQNKLAGSESKMANRPSKFNYDLVCWEFGKAETIYYKGCDPDVIWEGYQYLRGLAGNAQLSAGSTGTCGRVSCSWDDGIWFCQDVSSLLFLPTTKTLG